ncbi:hypothetical protein A4R63_04115 [Corynebacterium pseudotuberculosis]|uniref:hypothetical protein n=1 Tax=Corynebacterium pseudotuberculosis TaxID=1719 RepID=UPI0002592297|nr:hypothetical protein [Corynebacterium pseudotuberculosis]AFH90630.1 hypothetical protein CP31_04410 [Corynebacterium pseudotuberculosis 31]APB10733.1 hypothetical protein A4R72_04325 [Corynebacterium pseudotuberculosis]APB12779.1 hypothetical protein A4R71_04340 [Corynebacterium pseudotuberculosis]APB14830.1 hypothetical protein A4R68_04335 [Corynebacterium pseudotuberculosis]APB16872.1 hypothetical protein A4R67_04330 [Corynebacterium pseudotuberculosis]
MSFFEDIAAALDKEGLESRVHDDVMFVPITSDLEIQFVEIDPLMPAANVYIAAADVDEDDENFEAALVSVVFSVKDAVKTVAEHVATDQIVTVLRDLLDATDERIEDLDFFQNPQNPHMVHAEVAANSELQVVVEVVDGEPTAAVTFVAFGESFDELVDQAIEELWSPNGEDTLSEEDHERLFFDVAAELTEEASEILELGTFTDFDKLFDVLSLAADQADDWEEQLVPLDDEDTDRVDVYDIFTEDDEEFDLDDPGELDEE